ncbi:hypothetical protein AVEN_149598-1 [Araneus ventricosus]|uniref:Reverse transcriptase domain-containing protein n=1 Tax=Araneus ventricosus TaxID=182803 RepID=A0A4Y2VGM4_ARAVE|nr:hypothetical protein AVEN_149598-1 [Araneus ventricosus]
MALEDRKFLKFLSIGSDANEDYRVMQMTLILAFECKNSPFILSVVIKLHITKFEAEKLESVSMLNFGFYVDDLYFGADIVRKEIELLSDAETLLESGDFNLRNFSFYNSELKALWFEYKFSESEKESVKLNVFGLSLNLEKDVLSLEVKGLVDSLKTLDNIKCCFLQTAV